MIQYSKIGNIYKLKDPKLHNLTQYKYAKIHIEKLEAISKLINTALKGFELFQIYPSANEVVYTLRAQKTIVEGQINKFNMIIKNKGKQS